MIAFEEYVLAQSTYAPNDSPPFPPPTPKECPSVLVQMMVHDDR